MRKSELREEYESVFGVVEGSLGLYDADGSKIYNETSNGYWAKLKFDADGNLIYLEDSDGVICDNRPCDSKVFLDEQREGEKRMKQLDISMEQKREYGYMNRPPLIVANPIMLFITEDGGHRVKDFDGWVHYVPRGWITLKWLPTLNSSEGTQTEVVA